MIVTVDVHDIMIFTYTKINKFYYLGDLYTAIEKDIKKKFKLHKNSIIKLKGVDALAKTSKLSFIGRKLDENKNNQVKVLVCF